MSGVGGSGVFRRSRVVPEQTAQHLLVGGIVVCTVLMLGPFKPLADLILPSDKAAHVTAWYCLAGLMIAAFPRARLLDLFLAPVLLGVGLEFVQGLVGRSMEIGDILANGLGTSLALTPMAFHRLTLIFPRRTQGLAGNSSR